MLQNQIPVRRWKQWLVLPVLGGLFFSIDHSASAQTGRAQISPVPDEATQKVRRDIINRKVREAMRQDSLRTGGKEEPGTMQQFNITDMDGKPEDITVTIARVKIGQPPPPQVTADGERVYTYVEQMPHLPNASGMGPIVQQIQDNFVYPTGPHQEGRVFATFIVKADGSVGDTKIVKGLAPAYDEAVLAAIQKLPRFVPGMQSGKAVAVSFTVPITFKEKQ